LLKNKYFFRYGQSGLDSFCVQLYFPHTVGNARLLCEENSATLIDFATFTREKLTINESVLVADRIIVSDTRVLCVFPNSNQIWDTDCINKMTTLAVGAGLSFHSSEKELYRYLTIDSGKKMFYLVVNSTHLDLVTEPVGLVICKTESDTGNNTVFYHVVNNKYHENLGEMCRAVLQIMELKLDTLRKTFISVADQHTIASQLKLTFDDVCTDVRKLVLNSCSGTGTKSVHEWENYYLTNKDKLLAVDEMLRNVTQSALQHCSDKNEIFYDYVFTVYEHLASLHIKLDSLYVRYQKPGAKDSPETLIYRLLIKPDSTSGDIRGCLNEFASRYLTSRETSFLLVSIYNAKIKFLAAFSDHLLTEKLEYMTEERLSNSRNKRFIWTGPIAALTGLASEETVKAFNENAKQILRKEDQDAREIQHLENKTNEMLGSIQHQNQKVMKLYSDEIALQNALDSVMTDEKSLIKQLSTLTKALEIVSDVDIQYSSIMSAIDQIPALLQEAENLIMSVVNQRISPSMIPLSIKRHYTLPSLMHAEMVALVTPKGYIVRYKIPEITATFEVIELKTIPFPLGNNLFGKLKLESSLVPARKEGYSFLYTPDMCVEKDTTIMCKSYQVTIHAKPQVCAEHLVFNPATIPNKCQDTMQIVIPKEQEYIYQSTVDLITVFSPYKDTVTVSCARKNGTLTEHNIRAGLTNVQLPPSCKAVTSEMVIFAPQGTDNKITKMSTITWDMSDNLLSLADNFETVHGTNVTELETSFARYAN
jgi:hypothetical protein